MTLGKIIHGIRYIYNSPYKYLYNKNIIELSFEKNILNILKDIYFNAYDYGTCKLCVKYITLLSNNISILHNYNYIKSLFNWLNLINQNWFEFDEIKNEEKIDINNYIIFDEWWNEFNKIKKIVQERYVQLKSIGKPFLLSKL